MGPGHRAGMKRPLVSGTAVTVVTHCFDRRLSGVKGEPSHTQGGCPGEPGGCTLSPAGPHAPTRWQQRPAAWTPPTLAGPGQGLGAGALAFLQAVAGVGS